MSVLDQVRSRLTTNHPNLRFTEANGRIVVHAPTANGFDVSIDEDLVVGYDGWHDHFATPEEALNCFAFGFSDHCRLKVTHRGRFACRWTVESLINGLWVPASTTGLLLFPFWLRKRITYRQNALIKSA